MRVPRSRLLSLMLRGTALAACVFVSFANPHHIHRWALFLAAFILYPAAQRICDSAARKWRRPYTLVSMAAACAALGSFIVVVGNHQFAGWDCSVLIEVGWRLIQGQVPYRDFICPFPPGFILGVKYAYQLFGVQWDSILYMDAIFASISFLWIYGLLSGLLRHKLAAFLVALFIECASMLPISYWWYNSVTSVTAAIFLLSCLRYLTLPSRLSACASYGAALMLLLLMKPNTAFPLAAGAILLLFLATPARVRFTLLTLLSAGGLLLILALNNVSLTGLASSYRAVAAVRGLTTRGFDILSPADRLRTVLYVSVLLAPGCLRWWRSWRAAIGSRDTTSLCGHLLLLLGPVVGIFAMFTNMDMKDADFPLLICFSAVLLWGFQYEPQPGRGEAEGYGRSPKLEWRPGTPAWRRLVSSAASTPVLGLYVSFLCGLALSELYLGVARTRIPEHEYLEWTDTDHNPGVPYFRNMRASRQLNRVLTQAAEVVRDSPRPLFFGPHLEFAYAALGVPSPLHLPIWWDPGISYALADEPSIMEAWRRNGFATLIYLRQRMLGGPPLQRIREMYVQDDRWPELVVFHAKPVAPGGEKSAR